MDWHNIAPLLQDALTNEATAPETRPAEVFGDAAAGIARAADYLTRQYTLIATNPPWVQRNRQSDRLTTFCDALHPRARSDIAFALMERCGAIAAAEGSLALVTPQQWLTLSGYRKLRKHVLTTQSVHMEAMLGSGAFKTPMHPGTQTVLNLISIRRCSGTAKINFWVATDAPDVNSKLDVLRTRPPVLVDQKDRTRESRPSHRGDGEAGVGAVG